MLNLEKADEITKQGNKFYKDPEGYAMHRFSYFPCYKCKKPYFGGERVCEANVDKVTKNTLEWFTYFHL